MQALIACDDEPLIPENFLRTPINTKVCGDLRNLGEALLDWPEMGAAPRI